MQRYKIPLILMKCRAPGNFWPVFKLFRVKCSTALLRSVWVLPLSTPFLSGINSFDGCLLHLPGRRADRRFTDPGRTTSEENWLLFPGASKAGRSQESVGKPQLALGGKCSSSPVGVSHTPVGHMLTAQVTPAGLVCTHTGKKTFLQQRQQQKKPPDERFKTHHHSGGSILTPPPPD